MKVVVSGGAGFIGSHIVDRLLGRGDDAVVLDNLLRGRLKNLHPEARFLEVDIRTVDAVEAIRAEWPDGIVHQAAQVSIGHSIEQPLADAEINVLGSLRIIEAARQVGARVIFASSAAVYGTASTVPVPEDHCLQPAAPYGVAKLAVENYLRAYGVLDGLPYVALRYANVYGPRQDAHGEAGVIAIFCAAARENRELVINGDGRYTRDYVFVQDVVDAVVLALDAGGSGVFNVGTGIETDVNRLVELLGTAAGRQLKSRHGPARPGDVRRSALDPTLIGRSLGWRPRTVLVEGLRQTLASE